MRREVILLVLVIVAGTAVAGPSDDLNAARLAFRQKDCQSASKTLKDLLFPHPKLADPNETFDARVMLGACMVENGERENAKAEFEKALQIKPREPLDPTFFSESARRLFDDTRADIENRARKDEEIRKLQKQREEIAARLANLRVYRETPYAVNFLPFGFGQLQNGQTLKFALFGGGQLLTLGTSAGIWYYLVNKYGIRSDKIPRDDAESVLLLQRVEIGAGIAFIALYAWSVLVALRNYEPRRRVEGDQDLIKEIEGPNAPKPAPKKTATKSARESLRFGPMLTPNGGVGIGLGWEID
jgi:hypothetical protein